MLTILLSYSCCVYSTFPLCLHEVMKRDLFLHRGKIIFPIERFTNSLNNTRGKWENIKNGTMFNHSIDRKSDNRTTRSNKKP